MLQKKGMKLIAILTLLIAAGSSSAFAGTAAAGSVTFKDSSVGKVAYRTGIPQLIKMPFKIFVKAGESMENSGRSADDVAVSDAYNLDAETTG